LFDQIKNRIQQGNKQEPLVASNPQPRPTSQAVPASRPRPTSQAVPASRPRPAPQPRPVPKPSAATPLDLQTFGPFQSVDLANAFGGAAAPRQRNEGIPQVSSREQGGPNGGDGFFGVFEEVKLQG